MSKILKDKHHAALLNRVVNIIIEDFFLKKNKNQKEENKTRLCDMESLVCQTIVDF